MKLVVDPNLTVDDIVRAIEAADEYLYFGGELGPNTIRSLTIWLNGLDGFEGTLMEIMMHCNYTCENISVSFSPTKHGYMDGVGMINLNHPVLLLEFEGLTTPIAMIELPTHYYLTTDYVAYGELIAEEGE